MKRALPVRASFLLKLMRAMANRPHSLVIVVLAACSSQGSVGPSDAASVDETQLTDSSAPLADASEDATMDAQTPLVVGTDASCAGPPCDAGGVVLGEMHLFELRAPSPRTAACRRSFSSTPRPHFMLRSRRLRQSRGGNRVHCGSLRRKRKAGSGRRGCRLAEDERLHGRPAASRRASEQPIVCMREAGYYGCAYPSGTIVSGAFFAGAAAPLGPGPITFALPGAADFGARALSGAPIGIASTNEDLNAISL